MSRQAKRGDAVANCTAIGKRKQLMFGFGFKKSICKDMEQKLKQDAPDQELWSQLSAYLVWGKRPKKAKAQNALRAYLDLKDHLGPLANFRNGAELSHAKLDAPCKAFFKQYENGKSSQEMIRWARFCLAADHLLSCAYQADFVDKNSRKNQQAAVCELHSDICSQYLAPMEQGVVVKFSPSGHEASGQGQAAASLAA